MAGRRSLCGNPWVPPAVGYGRSDGGPPHPRVFVWAPEKLLVDWRLLCPTCAHTTSYSDLHAPRIVHTLNSHYLYVCTKHVCYYCSGSNSASKRPRAKMSADLPAVMACVPSSLKHYWQITTTGMALFDVEVLDHVRSMATRTSWSALADGINEMKCADWERRRRYTKQCSARLPNSLKVNPKLLRSLYMRDASERHGVVLHGGVVYVTPQLDSMSASDILCFDWTVDAAKRCGSPYLLNVMCNNNKVVLLSVLTQTTAPNEISSAVADLALRGVNPKVVYVDDHCCGAWRTVLQRIWPRVAVRLDIMHAIRRLTQTVSSTQHPWHGEFCRLLSSAVYTFDGGEQKRLRTSWRQAGNRCEAPQALEKTHVSRFVADPSRISSTIDDILATYSRKRHAHAGPLLTPATRHAWASLKVHVLAGCLCDPPGVQLNKYGDEYYVGGEAFKEVASMRGSSALEGFHAHQKQWLGPFATHAVEAGAALLRDGTARWNCSRQRGDDTMVMKHT